MSLPLTGPSLPPKSGKTPEKVVVLLHGLGADGDDLIGMAPYFSSALPNAEFLAPHAPYPCDMAPFGRQWFSLQDRHPEALLAGLRQIQPIFDAYLDAVLAERGLTEADLALVGFSQGTMLSLHCALRRKTSIAGLIGYSGLLAAPDRLVSEIASRPPVLLVHGEQDSVVDFSFMDMAAQALSALGVPVTALARPGLDHSIDDAGLSRGIEFLVNAFGGNQA